MRAAMEIEGKGVEVTTEHAGSSYGIPVVVVDGEIVGQVAEYVPDECNCTILGLLADQAGVWGGPATRRELSALGVELYGTRAWTGAECDDIIAQFRARKEANPE